MCGSSAFGLVLPDSLNIKVALDSALASREVVEASPDILEEELVIESDPNDTIKHYVDLARTLVDKVRASQNFIRTPPLLVLRVSKGA
jgi:hypothetical protein